MVRSLQTIIHDLKASNVLTYLGHVPASAMFATNARFKRESFRASEFAPRILADNGLPVVMKVRSQRDNTYQYD